jgi:DNA-binding IclR family transcriptional regulator
MRTKQTPKKISNKPPKKTSKSDAPYAPVQVEAGDGVKSLHFGLDVLEMLVNSGSDKGVTDVAHQLDMTKVRAFRLLSTLVDRGYVVQDPTTSRYAPSIRLFALGQALGERFNFASAIKPDAERLWDKLGHSVVIATPFKGRMLILEVLRGRTPINIGLKVGAALDMHASAQGRIALAFGARDAMAKLGSKPLTKHTPRTIVDLVALQEEIRQARLKGWASAPDQFVIGMNTVAAPVFQYDGTLAGTIAVCGLTQFVADPPTAELLEELTSATWRASRRLGWSGKIVPRDKG